MEWVDRPKHLTPRRMINYFLIKHGFYGRGCGSGCSSGCDRVGGTVASRPYSSNLVISNFYFLSVVCKGKIKMKDARIGQIKQMY